MRFLRTSSVRYTGTDYSAAVARAVAWLGNHYLLAIPAPRLSDIECSLAQPHGRTSDEASTSPEKEFSPAQEHLAPH
jgi:hypothetical protein